MASVDGSKSIYRASDETFDNTCGPCKEDNIDMGANQYCVDCRVYLCNNCKDVHRKLPISKNHKLISDSKILAAKRSVCQGSSPKLYCGCNTNNEVNFYCENHDDIMCSPCRSIKHHKCKSLTVQEKSSSYSTQVFNTVLSKTRSMKDKFNKMKKECTEDVKKIKILKEACRKEIQTFRKELNTFLDKLEIDMLRDLDKTAKIQLKRLDQQISTLITALQMLDSDYRLLENAKQDGRKSMMFTSDLQVSKRLQDYESRFKDLCNDIRKPALSFERNKILADIHSNIKALGNLRRKHNFTSPRKKILLGKKIQSQRKVNVKTDDDQCNPRITGCTVFSSGHIVLCDCQNQKLKSLDTDSVLQKSLTLPDQPWDVSAVDDNNVIVTLPWKMQLQHTQVLPQMKSGRVIQLDKKCWGVEVSGDEIYTTCHNDPGKGEVRILDLSGNIKRRFGIKQDGSAIFISPFYISVSQSGKKIFVSDDKTASVTCLTVDGNIYYQYRHDDFKWARGLIVDAQDNVLVCEQSSRTAQVITADGSKHEILLSSSELQHLPYSLAYRDSDDALVVGCFLEDNVFLFKLVKKTLYC